MADLASRLRELREKRGQDRGTPLTQEELAKVVGCSSNYLSMLESGQRTDPSLSLLEAIADYFSVSLDYLRGREPRKLTPNEQLAEMGVWMRGMGATEDDVRLIKELIERRQELQKRAKGPNGGEANRP